jgi:hypothetical protein
MSSSPRIPKSFRGGQPDLVRSGNSPLRFHRFLTICMSQTAGQKPFTTHCGGSTTLGTVDLVAGTRGRFFIATVVIALGLSGAFVLSPTAGAVNSPFGAVGKSATTPGWETALGFARSVSADSPTDAWMVQYCNGVKTCKGNVATSSLMHWDGTSWSSATSLYGWYLNSVIAESPNDAWAAGLNEFAPEGAAVLHWDGAHWTNTAIPGAAEYSNLFALSADSPTDAWAVGYNDRADGSSESFIVHWNGATWSQVSSPSPGSDSYQLLSVSAVSNTDAWAVGYSTDATGALNAFILHWDGSKWLQFASPTSTSDDAVLNAVSATTGGAWAVGTTGNENPSFAPLVLHLSGGKWSEVTSPDPGGTITQLNAVSTISPSDAWMVGDYCTNANCEGNSCTGSDCGTENNLIEHWNGQVWAEVKAPDPSPSINEIYGLATDGASDAWAVGLDQGTRGNKALTLRWNGKRWSNFWPG